MHNQNVTLIHSRHFVSNQRRGTIATWLVSYAGLHPFVVSNEAFVPSSAIRSEMKLEFCGDWYIKTRWFFVAT